MSVTAIQMVQFALQCAVLHLFVKTVKRKSYNKHFIRAVLCVGMALGVHRLACGWIQPFFNVYDTTLMAQAGSLTLLYIFAFPLIRSIMRPGFLLAPIAGLVLLATTFGLQFISNSYIEPAQITSAPEFTIELPTLESSSNVLEVITIATDGLAAAKVLKKDKALGSDLMRGIALFKERKAWMDNLTPEEKADYQADMRQFLSDQGLAEDPSSLAAIRSANPTNLTVMASLFEHLDKIEGGTVAERSNNIADSLSKMTRGLKGMNLSAQDQSNLKKVSEMLASNNPDGAMAEARKQLTNSNGNNKLAGTIMAALMQAKSGVPADMLVADKTNKKAFDFGEFFSFKKKDEPKPAAEAASIADDPIPETKTRLAEASIEEIEIDVSPTSHIPISAHLGIVHVPSEKASLGEWISTVHSLHVNGYASLGGETVILLTDGTMYRNGDVWQLEHKGYQYRFFIDKVLKNKVHLTGLDRVALVPQTAQL